jgi:hypothetical protein
VKENTHSDGGGGGGDSGGGGGTPALAAHVNKYNNDMQLRSPSHHSVLTSRRA